MDTESAQFELDSKTVGALPIINRIIERIGLPDILTAALPSRPSQKLSHVDAVLLFLRNILLERKPLYRLHEWAASFEPNLLGLASASPSILNDDRVGRSLDALFDADRASLLTHVVLAVIREFAVELSQFHNDSTTVTVYGNYNAQRSMRKGRSSIAVTHGYNKDFRPDLKQVLFSLTVSRDGAVPLHYKAFDGNTTDDQTHIPIWESLRRLAGRSDFIYVADSKLCTREQTDYISKEGGRFITVLPETRNECTWFLEYKRSHKVEWQRLLKRPDHRRPGSAGAWHHYWGFESPLPSEEGFRILWIRSSQKRDLDVRTRQARIEKTIAALDSLKSRVGARQWWTKERITAAVEEILSKYKAVKWFDWKLISSDTVSYKQKGKGRPGKNRHYTKVVKSKWSFEALPNPLRIQADADRDGIFPLLTNIPAADAPMKQILLKYKYQPYIEKRHQQFKSVFSAAPVFLKAPHRIEALMFVYFLVLLVNALIEREMRLSMAREGISSLPLYPEERKCKHPTTERLLEVFETQRRHILSTRGKQVQLFVDPLTKIQETLLDLLSVSKQPYTS
jgi:transposase